MKRRHIKTDVVYSTWVAHPALTKIASDIFNEHMPTPNQLFVRREDVKITARDLLNMNVPGKITEDGIRKNLAIGLGYIEAWIRGIGCVPINYLMYVSFALKPSLPFSFHFPASSAPPFNIPSTLRAFACSIPVFPSMFQNTYDLSPPFPLPHLHFASSALQGAFSSCDSKHSFITKMLHLR